MATPVQRQPAFLATHRDMIESALRAAIGGDSAAIVAASRYVMGWENERGRPASNTGKRVRPALCVFACEAFGGSPESALPGAVAVELVHNFSLVHDEVQDHDPERHHRPTLWALLGEAQAINVGDFLFTRAVEALTDAIGPVERRMAALRTLNAAIGRMIAGQWEDIAFESRETVTVDEYLAMTAGKTGALLSAPVQIGALLAGVPEEQAELAGKWGLEVGLAFQAHDDFLGTWGQPGLTGKSNTNDIARRKKTLPIVHGMQHPGAADVIRSVYARESLENDDISAVVAALESAGSDAYCRELARSHAERADSMLDALALPEETRARFRAVGAYLVERSS